MRRLQELHDQHGAEANERELAYAMEYKGRRGSMVVDVVASRQRRYVSRVRDGLVRQYDADATSKDLRALAENPPHWFPLRRGEDQTMADVAAGLVQWGEEQGCASDEDTVRSWALGAGRGACALRPTP